MAMTWDTSIGNWGITFTNGNRTGTAFADFPRTGGQTAFAGKKYIELTLASVGALTLNVGVVNATWLAGSDWIGNGNGCGLFLDSSGIHYVSNNVYPFSVKGSAPANGDVISIAIDVPNSLIWLRCNGGSWNAGGTANPATGVGGDSLAGYGTLMAGLLFGSTATGDSVAMNTGASAFAYTPPSGFVGPDAATPVSVLSTTTPALRLVRQAGKSRLITTTPAPVNTRQTGKFALITTTPIRSLLAQKVFLKALSIATTLSATLSRQAGKPRLISSTPPAALVRQAAKAPGISTTPPSAITRQTAKARLASTTPSGVVTASKTALRALLAAATPAVTLVRSAGKGVSAASAGAVVLVRGVGKGVRASVAAVASLLASGSSQIFTVVLRAASSPMARLASVVGRLWTRLDPASETWTRQPDNAETWTPVAGAPATWTRR